MKANAASDVWKRVAKGRPSECWPYTGSTFSGRYGRFFIGRKSVLAHRVVYELVVGRVPTGLFVMHICNNKLCCNPSHLTVGSNSENQRHASNCGAWPVGVTGIRGVSLDRKRGYWRAQGYLNGKMRNLYTGPHLEKAIAARAAWEEKHGISFTTKEHSMHTFNNTAAQGDVYFKRVDTIPAHAKAIQPADGKLVITHSETGHSHVMVLDRPKASEPPAVEMFAGDNPLMAWLKVNRPTALTHLRTHDTHAPILFKPGNYEVRRQREYTPEGFRRVED